MSNNLSQEKENKVSKPFIEHRLSDESQTEYKVGGESVWVPTIGIPYFTTKGLSLFQRLGGEKNWRPECACGRIFENLEDYEAHIVYKNSPYGGEL